MKTDFDPNLIPYYKIFQNEKLFNIYERTKQNNLSLPNNWKQLDLFTWNMTGMALLLGLDKEDVLMDWLKNDEQKEQKAFKFKYYFLIEDRNEPGIILQLKTFSVGCVGIFQHTDKKKYFIADKPFNMITALNIKVMKKEAVISGNFTLKRFLNNFSVIDDWECVF